MRLSHFLLWVLLCNAYVHHLHVHHLHCHALHLEALALPLPHRILVMDSLQQAAEINQYREEINIKETEKAEMYAKCQRKISRIRSLWTEQILGGNTRSGRILRARRSALTLF